MNTEKTICFEKMIWPIILVSLICFPILYTAAIYVYVYVIDMNDQVFFDILLGTLGRLMKGMIASANSFLPIMFLYCFFALKHKILWLFIPVVGLLAPIFVELILIDDWSSQSLLQYISQERMEIICLHLSSVISSCMLYLIYKLMCRKYTCNVPE